MNSSVQNRAYGCHRWEPPFFSVYRGFTLTYRAQDNDEYANNIHCTLLCPSSKPWTSMWMVVVKKPRTAGSVS
ncbi:hypothetical protein XENTR_v10009069 [Xenopus tropicalis]|nr:hypothetical protein XENTR_v10009069 [Xenopus tropicalis]